MRGVSGVVGVVVTIALVVGGLAVVGHLNPQRQLRVGTDRLGPESGEQVTDYLARAEASLLGNDAEPRWGSVSFDRELTAEQVGAVTTGAVSIPGVAVNAVQMLHFDPSLART